MLVDIWRKLRAELIILVTVRLAPLLKTDVAVVQFPNVRNATEAVKDILNKGIGIRACCFTPADSALN